MAKEENPGVHLGPQYTWRSQGTPLCRCRHHAHTHRKIQTKDRHAKPCGVRDKTA